MARTEHASKRIDLSAVGGSAGATSSPARAARNTRNTRGLATVIVLGVAAAAVWYFTSGDSAPPGAPVAEVIGGAPAPGPALPAPGASAASTAGATTAAPVRAAEPTHTPSGEPIVVPLKRSGPK